MNHRSAFLRIVSVPATVLLTLAIVTFCFAESTGDMAAARELPDTVSFNAHIRPIMSGTCFTCHGPDEEDNVSDLRLDSFSAATQSAIVPGDAEASLVYQRLIDADDPMPPTEFRHQLTSYDKSLFKKWIDQGAKYEQHWSYTPIAKPRLPSTHQADGNPIDEFIRARLAAEGLQPSPRADKPTLLRRLSLDLIGIPPTIEELDDFIADSSDDAYAKQVERLLQSPHYGERMASQWLDLVRFTDTVGYHGDQNQRIFSYRDYVIDAINKNKPFDQFTLEQLAGDLLDNPTEEQLVATGLIRLNMMTREGGAQPGEYRAKYTADRVRMIGTAWLGATTGCCECHNHKYDPFTAKDFYSIGAFFDDVRQWGVYTSYGYTPNKDLEGFNNESPFPPELRLKSASLAQEMEVLQRNADAAAVAKCDLSQPLDDDVAAWAKDVHAWLQSNPNGWRVLSPTSVTSSKKSPIEVRDDRVLLSGPPKKSDVLMWNYATPYPITVRSFQMEVLPDEANGGFVGRSAEGRFSTSFDVRLKRATADAKEESVKIAFGQADRQNPVKYEGGQTPRYLEAVWNSGPAVWQLPADESSLPHTAVFHLDEPLVLEQGDQLTLRLASTDVGCFRISISPLAGFVVGQTVAPERLVAALATHDRGEPLDDSLKSVILAAHHASHLSTNAQNDDFKIVRDQILDCHSGYAMTMISQPLPADQVPTARVLPRGNWQDVSGEVVTPAFPEFLHESDSSAQRLTRIDLAHWLTSDENPLVARHYVNRTWKHFFGAGLSNKLDDLGSQGEWPSHPELLDWLAGEFRESWDMKQITRAIVMSQTYQQAAAVRDDLQQTDPYNRLLSQQTPRRLEAEAVRDNALAIAGLLQTNIIGGRSVFPYQPEGYYDNLQFPDRRYDADKDFREYRRGVYMHWQRTFLHPMLVNFDAPARDECVADRTQSNSPQQALTLLNDPSFVEASRALCDRLMREIPADDVDRRIDRAFKLALSRPPREDELSGLRSLYERQLQHFTANPDEANAFTPGDNSIQRASLGQVCRVILNLHETVTRY